MANSLHDWDYPQSPTYPQGTVTAGFTAPPSRPARPAAIRRAVLLMHAGAALTVVQGVARGLTTNNVTSYTSSPASPHTATLHDSRSLVAGIIGGVVFAAFWVWMARKNGAGRNWARVLSTVFFGLLSLQLAGSMVTLARSALPVLDFVVILALWGVGLAATIYLWQRESSMFFRSARQATPAGGYRAAYPGNQFPGYARPPQLGQPDYEELSSPDDEV